MAKGVNAGRFADRSGKVTEQGSLGYVNTLASSSNDSKGSNAMPRQNNFSRTRIAINDLLDRDSYRRQQIPVTLAALKFCPPEPERERILTGGDLHRQQLKFGPGLRLRGPNHYEKSKIDLARDQVSHNQMIVRKIRRWLTEKRGAAAKLPEVISGDALLAALPGTIRQLQTNDTTLTILLARAVRAQGGGKLRPGKDGAPRVWALRNVERYRVGRGKRRPTSDLLNVVNGHPAKG